MLKTKFKFLLSAFFVALVMTSCASAPKQAAATLTKTESRAFWRIDGTDKNGNPSTVYIQGTFHLGDERIFPLSEEVQQAFLNADRYAGELSTQSYADLENQAAVLYAPNKDGKLISDYMNDEENAYLKTVFLQQYDSINALDPWIISNTLTTLIYQQTGLSSEFGLDNSFTDNLKEMNRTWDGLDELSVQLEVLTFGDYDEQITNLKDTIQTLTNAEESYKLFTETLELYENYVNDDMQSFEKSFTDSTKLTIKSDKSYKKYYQKLFTDRNKEWACDITNYLNEGGTTFIFAGCGHWVGKDSTFAFLKKMKTIN